MTLIHDPGGETVLARWALNHLICCLFCRGVSPEIRFESISPLE
jgi:hypothetical protein